jgi:hypothetical protein
LTFDHELVSALVAMQFPGDGAAFFNAAVPYITSVGRIDPYFTANKDDAFWSVTDVANHFNGKIYRPFLHMWEFKGRTTIKLVTGKEFGSNFPPRETLNTVRTLLNRFVDGLEWY